MKRKQAEKKIKSIAKLIHKDTYLVPIDLIFISIQLGHEGGQWYREATPTELWRDLSVYYHVGNFEVHSTIDGVDCIEIGDRRTL